MASKYNIGDRVIIRYVDNTGKESIFVGDVSYVQTNFGITVYQLKQTGFTAFDEEEIVGVIKTKLVNGFMIKKEVVFTQDVSESLQEIVRRDVELSFKRDNFEDFYVNFDGDEFVTRERPKPEN